MTLVLATRSGNGATILAWDRMLSIAESDARFETLADKVMGLHHSIALLYSGGQDLSAEIEEATIATIHSRFDVTGTGPSVREASEIYHEQYVRTRIEYAEAEVLPNYQIPTRKEYDKRRRRLDPALVKQIDRELAEFDFDERTVPSVIIAGIDTRGPHIYLVDGGNKPRLRNKAGFAAAGVTSGVAEEFLIEQHAPDRPYGEALVLTYIAKKKGESRAQGVGGTTGILVLGPSLGQAYRFHENEVAILERLYRGIVAEGRGPIETAVAMASQIKLSPWDLFKPPIEPPDPSKPQSPPESTHGP